MSSLSLRALVNTSLATLTAAGVLLTVLSAQAEDSSTSSTAPAAASSTVNLPKVLKNKTYEEDTSITDAKIKADSGSLSRYSVKFNLSYYGPVMDDFSRKNQPNPDNSIGVTETSLGGSIATRYRIDSDRTISFGTGLNAIAPTYGFNRVDVNNPYMSYDVTRKYKGIQFRSSPGISYVTVPNYVNAGEFAGTNWDLSAVYMLGMSRWGLSLDSSVAWYWYSRPYIAPEGKNRGDGNAQRDNVAIYPGFKYVFTDKLSLLTSLAISWWNPRKLDDQTALLPKYTTQRVGLGWAVKRDVFFFPYLNIYPTNASVDTTTVNFSTVFSIL